jgi:serine/threonine-protein kinase
MSDETQQNDQLAEEKLTDEKRVRQLVAQWEGLLDQGQFVPAEELCAECPELLNQVQQLINAEGPTADEEEGDSGDVGVMATVVEPDAAKRDQPGALVLSQKYRKLTFLAKGGLGEVYVADDQDLRREVAIKFIKARYKNRRDCTEQFQLEAEITARLDHPGVVPVYGYGRSPDGRLCYAMRFIQGETLEERIARLHAPTKKSVSAFSQERSVEFRGVMQQFITVCNTIAYAHNRGILHRDIKPENIMLGKYDDTLVVDWGLAMTVDRDETQKASGEQTLMPNSGSGTSSSGSSGGAVGTPAYMSPEQAKGEGMLTAATDIFALGCTLYKLLTGRAPYTGDNARETLTKARYGTFEPPQHLNPDVPPQLAAICTKAMQLDPDDRYFTAIEMAYDLERYLAGETVLAYTESSFERFRRWRRINSTLWHSLVSVVLLLAVGLTVGLTSSYNQQQNLVLQRLEHLRAEGHFYNHVIVSGFDELRKDVRLLGNRTHRDQGRSQV